MNYNRNRRACLCKSVNKSVYATIINFFYYFFIYRSNILEDSSTSNKSFCGASAFVKTSVICFSSVHTIWASFGWPFHLGMICLLSIISPEFVWCCAQCHGGFCCQCKQSHLTNSSQHGLIWIVICWRKMLHHTHQIMLIFLLLVWTQLLLIFHKFQETGQLLFLASLKNMIWAAWLPPLGRLLKLASTKSCNLREFLSNCGILIKLSACF